eukprot:TRINITY_DN8201_c0_g1_i1.p1 TRINITY_DN8201_c0_g1~~TRINITY_DN8201_c0_g1_i1.p1  ORF type:complete len:409 (-),score=40.21 TRINITY_DN8201_c0_g1_i1:537-1763(-)
MSQPVCMLPSLSLGAPTTVIFRQSLILPFQLRPLIFSCRRSIRTSCMAEVRRRHDGSDELLLQTPTLGGTLQRAVQVERFEGPKKYLANTKVVNNKHKPLPGSGEVLIRMRLRPLNPADGLSLMGLYPGFKPAVFPATPGLEGMGVVDRVGAGVDKFQVGQRVVPLMASYARSGEGSWQEYVKVAETDLVRVPEGVSDESAAQLVVNPITAYGMLEDFAAPPGEYIVQTAAGSAVGRLVIALAKQREVRTINVVRRRAQVEELRTLGADEVICSEDEDVLQRVKDITDGRLAWGAIDCLAGAMTKTVVACVRDHGTAFVLGGFTSPDCTVGIGDLIFRGVTLKGWWLSHFLGQKAPKERVELLEKMLSLMESKVIAPLAGERYDLADFASAVKKQQELGRQGKILLSG